MLKLPVRTRRDIKPEFTAWRLTWNSARQHEHYLPRPADDQGICGKEISKLGPNAENEQQPSTIL